MPFGLYDCNNLPFSKTLVKDFDSYADAVAHAKVHYEIACFAEDTDQAEPAADFITMSGRQFAIEPINAAA